MSLCPHYDRASIARHYLTRLDYQSNYLIGGLLKLVEELWGDDAWGFIHAIHNGQRDEVNVEAGDSIAK